MFDLPDLPERPPPRRSLRERALEWFEWVGPGRVVGGAVVVLAVVAGAYWLVRPPAASPESTLPFAPGAGSSGVAASSTSAPADQVPAAVTTVVPDEVVVHVAGAVAAPGVYSLPVGSRVVDAVAAAGGTKVGAQPDAVNLAAPLADGERVYIPVEGEAVPVASAPGGDIPAGPVDLNRATVEQLDDLPGVGPATAAAIVAHRDANGPFASVDDLADVRGIGPAKLAAIRDLVTV
ncbi:MAG: putative competence protein ComEA [Actinomycetota bacterium]